MQIIYTNILVHGFQCVYYEVLIPLISIILLDYYVYARTYCCRIGAQFFHMTSCTPLSVLIFYVFIAIKFWIHPS